jgi:uncharacterized protein
MSEGVTFRTAPFSEETELTGPVKLKLWVKPSTSDMEVFTTLRLIDPSGRDVTFDGASEPRAPSPEHDPEKWIPVFGHEIMLHQ